MLVGVGNRVGNGGVSPMIAVVVLVLRGAMEEFRLWVGRDAIVMEGSAGGDEDGVDAERSSAGVGHGCAHLHPRARQRIA